MREFNNNRKVKIFGFGSISYSIPSDINKWFDENKDIEIVEILQSSSLVGKETHLIISIFYIEPTPADI
jgi:hypothetical protein